jgi:hypothetical protein
MAGGRNHENVPRYLIAMKDTFITLEPRDRGSAATRTTQAQ